MNWEKLLEKIITWSFLGLLFITPLLFTPFNFELFEFPKMIFVYLITTIITTAWILKMLVRKEFRLAKTPLDWPILLYLISSIISTILSINPHTSLWGYYSRFHGGLVSTICYILLYYAFLSNIVAKHEARSTKFETNTFLIMLLSSAALVSLYAILEHFGIDEHLWVQDVRNRVFSTLGQPNWLGAFLASLIFIPLGLITQCVIRNKQDVISNKQKVQKFLITVYCLLFTVYFLAILFTNSKSAIFAFWVCFVLFIGLISQLNKKAVKVILPIFLTTLIIYLLLGSKTYSYLKKTGYWLKIFSSQTITQPAPLKPDQPFISESSEIRKVVWRGTLAIWQHYPIFGSGVETFGYAYYNFRPVEHNLLSEWDFLYNKAHNEFLNILACQGIVGLVCYLLIVLGYFRWVLGIWKCEVVPTSHIPLLISLFCGFLCILITNFFGFSVVITGLLFFLLPAFSFSLNSCSQNRRCKDPVFTFTDTKSRDVKTGSLHLWQGGMILVILIMAGLSLIKIINIFRADYFYAQGEANYGRDKLIDALTNYQKAVQLNSREPLLHAGMAKSSAKLAVLYYQADATNSGELISQLSQLAESEAQLALLLNPRHLNLYKNQAEVYLLLSYLDPKYKLKAIQTLQAATKLAPTDPKLVLNLGLLEWQEENYSQAIAYLKKAVSLKPNYLTAYLKLAELLKQTGQKDQAITVLNIILEKVSLDNQEALEMLKNLEASSPPAGG